jgi:hypothetical protein
MIEDVANTKWGPEPYTQLFPFAAITHGCVRALSDQHIKVFQVFGRKNFSGKRKEEGGIVVSSFVGYDRQN